MPNTIIIDDSFTDLPLNQTLHGRTPTVSTGSIWAIEGSSTSITGGGNGDIKFNVSTSGLAAKIPTGRTDCAVQIELIQFSSVETYCIFLRDTANTVFPRYGYTLRFTPLFNPAYGIFSIGTVDNYNITLIPGQIDIQWPFNSGKNIIAFEAIGTNFRVIINNQIARSFSNTTIAFNVNASKHSIVCWDRGDGAGRVERFTVYDSIVIEEIVNYPIIYFG